MKTINSLFEAVEPHLPTNRGIPLEETYDGTPLTEEERLEWEELLKAYLN